MDIIFKKYFWVINLGALTLLAFFVATSINDVLVAQLFSVPKADVKGATATSSEAPRLGRLAMTDHPGDTLKERYVFDLDPKEDQAPEKPDEPDEPDEPEDTNPEGELEESELPIDLEGTAPNQNTKVAMLKVEGESKIAFVGSTFLDGKAKIADIQPRYIVVKEGKDFRVIKLWSDKAKSVAGRSNLRGGRPDPRAARNAASAAKRPLPRSSAASRNAKRKEVAKGVKKTGAYSYEIDKKMLDTQLADLSKLGSQARIVPNYRGGKYQGFKLVGVRPGSLYRQIGIRSGDVITSVNGKAIDSPNKAITMFEQFKNSSNIEIGFTRRGQDKTLNYSIK